MPKIFEHRFINQKYVKCYHKFLILGTIHPFKEAKRVFFKEFYFKAFLKFKLD